MRPFFNKLFSAVRGLLSGISRGYTRIFGAVSWTPPAWAAQCRTRVVSSGVTAQAVQRIQKIRAHLAQHGRAYRWSAVGVIVLFVLSIAGYLVYQALPKPTEFTLRGTPPSATRLVENATPDSLRISISGSAARLEQIGKPITQGISLTPAMNGEWRWDSESHLTFTPTQEWAVGQAYVVRLDKSLFPDHVRLSDYTYHFVSATFTPSISTLEFYQDPKNPKIKKVVATVIFTHAVDTADFEKRITLRMAGQKEGFLGLGAQTYPFKVSYNKFKGEAYIHSDPIEIPAKDSAMSLVIDDGVRSLHGGPAFSHKLESKVTIPGMFNFFRIQSAQLSLVRNERYEPEQVMVIQTTAGVEETRLQKNLSVYLLPKTRPALQDQPARENYHYYSTEEIGPEILKAAEKVVLEPLPTDREYATLHSFKYKAEVGRHVYIKLDKGIESYGGYILANVFDAIATVPDFPKELNIMYDGAILSHSGEKKVSMLARDIEAVRFQVARILPSQINHLITQSSGQFRSPQFNNYQFSPENISEYFTEIRDLKQLEHGKTQYFAFDLSKYVNSETASSSKRGLFFYKIEGMDATHKHPIGVEDSRLILVTNLGVLVKDNADGSHDVFVQSIQDGQPVAGAQVQVLGKNGLPIVNETTDANGRVSLPSLSNFEREKTPTVYLVRRGEDFSFLPYQRGDRQLNFSRFDISGEVTSSSGDGLNAYLFSDRGIYRPGDVFHVGAIIKAASWQESLAGIPLETVITDARGQEVQKNKISLSAAGFEELSYQTEETSPTGNYRASVYLVSDGHRSTMIGETSVRVEEFLPDRLKISTRFSQERLEGWVSPADLKANVSLKNLFGTAATDRRVAANITLSPAYPAFRAYKEYSFSDPAHAKNSFNERLPDQQTDAEGNASFDLNLGRFAAATYRLSFLAEGYEAEGGRGVNSESSVLVSPLEYLVGYKADGSLRYIKKGATRSIEFIAIDPALKKTAVTNLKAQVIEQRYVSVLTQQSNGTYKYQSVRKEIAVSKNDISISAQGLQYPLPTSQPGDYVVIIRGNEDVELSRVEFSIAGSANLTRSLEKNAELQIKLSKTDYAPGEEIELEIKAPYTGAGLITIERDRVYTHRWFKTTTTASIQRIRVPADLEGNGYVNVSFLRAMDSPEIFMSPLSYGVVPFSISREKRINTIQLNTAEIARPGEPYRIRYQTAQPGKIVVFAVDEGILQVANYQTPDPLAHYFKKRALQVQTAQILDLILPEYKLTQQLSAPGGDQEGLAAIGKNLNPFKRRRDKPIVYWSGIIDTDSKSHELIYDVPDYFNGTLRVMAVAVSADTIGVAQKKAFIRGHFVLSPNVPTFVAPGDEFEVSVGVANNVEGSGNDPEINLELKTSEHLEVIGQTKQVLKIGEGKESSMKYQLRAKTALGSGNLTFTASMADKRSKASVDLSVRPPVPFMTTVSSGHFKSGQTEVAVPRKIYPQYRTLEATASPMPLGMSRGLIGYLNTYPYLCTEQLVSRAFPAIILRHQAEFGYAPDKVEATLEQTMRILRARQNAEGAFGFWAANSHVSDMQTVYALHFLTEAKEKGSPVATDVLQRGLEYLKNLQSRESDSLSEARVQAYAIYILARNGVVTTNYLNSLRKRLDAKQAKLWKKDLTGAYLAATYKLLKKDGEAESLISDSRLGDAQQSDYAYFYDGMVRDAQLLYVLARHFPDRLKKVSGDEMLALVKPLTQGNYNTISSAYLILGLDAYATSVGLTQALEMSMTEIRIKGKQPLVLPKGLFPRVEFSEQAEKILIESPGPYNTFYQVTQSGFDLGAPDKEIKQRLEVQREYRDAQDKVVTTVPRGEEIEVHVKLRAVEKGGVQNVAIVDLLPGGFEVVIDATRGSNKRAVRPTEPVQPPVPQDNPDEQDGNRQQVMNEEGMENQELPRGEGGEADGMAAPDVPVTWYSPITSPKSTWIPQYVDIREDRVVIFGTVSESVQEFVYRIKATNKGTFVIPPVFAEGMYDRNVQGRSVSGKIIVEANK